MLSLKRTILVTSLIFFATFAISQKSYEYPVAPKDTVFDVYFEDTVSDPYQWMENPDDPRLSEWLDEQKKITKKQSNKQTQIWTLRNQIATMYNKVRSEKTDSYVKKEKGSKSKYLFKYEYRSLGRSADLLYRKRTDSNFKTLVKIKNFQDGKDDKVDVTGRAVSTELEKAAVVITHKGSDWREAYFFDLTNGKQLNDTLKYLRNASNLIWHNNGVYYARYDAPMKGRELLDIAKGQALYYHKIGSPQSEDKLLYQNPDTSGLNDFTFFIDDDRLFFYHYYLSRGTLYKALSYTELNDDNSIFLRNFLILQQSDSIYFDIKEVIGDTAILRTNLSAPNGKVLMANIKKKNELLKLIPEYDIILREVNRLGEDKLACIYRNDGQFLALIFDLNGNLLKTIDFAEGEKVKYFYEYDFDVEYTNFCVSSFYHPDLWYQLSLKDLTFKPAKKIWVPYNPKDLETRYVKYKSNDGTEIPMYITCLKNTELNGKNPTLIYAYGGYGRTIEPGYNESLALWILHGGILAVPNVRGGGAEGSNWSKAGQGLKKQNTIDDFIAAGEYLLEKKYTNPSKLAIKGGSHGGFLVGAALTQRPELYKAVIADAGVFDMLRFEKFTIGSKQGNLKEFGTVTTNEGYKNKKSFSPLHSVHQGVNYPNVLLFTGDTDDRVPPLHSYKFLATLQEMGSSNSLYHLYVIPGAGHGGALTPEDWVDKMLFEYYFLFDQLDVKFW